MRGMIRAESASKFAPPYPQIGERDKQLVSRDGRAMEGVDFGAAEVWELL
jgi:hypothetical protein